MTKSKHPSVLLSIKPHWVNAILSGQKNWEYRRTPPAQQPPYDLLLYATAPTSAIVGEATVRDVKQGAIDTVVDATIQETPHSKPDLIEYFDGRDLGSALHLVDPVEYPRPINLDVFAINRPPQNFQYLERRR